MEKYPVKNSVMIRSLHYENNRIVNELEKTIPRHIVETQFRKYFIGTSNDSSAVAWFCNSDFEATNAAKYENIDSEPKTMFDERFFTPCLFGQHLISSYTKLIFCYIENPLTAVIADLYLPYCNSTGSKYVWISGNLSAFLRTLPASEYKCIIFHETTAKDALKCEKKAFSTAAELRRFFPYVKIKEVFPEQVKSINLIACESWLQTFIALGEPKTYRALCEDNHFDKAKTPFERIAQSVDKIKYLSNELELNLDAVHVLQ